jgi:hypothetical protein
MVDERLLALQQKYPYNLHNLHKFYEVTYDPQTGKKGRYPHSSFAVEIPRAGREEGSFGLQRP